MSRKLKIFHLVSTGPGLSPVTNGSKPQLFNALIFPENNLVLNTLFFAPKKWKRGLSKVPIKLTSQSFN